MIVELLLLLWQALSIDAPDGQKLLLTYQAKGVQVYTCEMGADGSYQWSFDRPEAELLDEKGEHVGRHFAGPSWESYDGSKITGKTVSKQAAAEASAIPWLLLSAESHAGLGVFQHVEYIQRVNTKGGAAPAAGCDAAHVQTKSRIPYTATYKFYRGQ